MAVKTFTAGSVLTAADLNDNMVQKGLVTTKGDLLVGTTDSTITRLAIGTNNYVLTADSAEASGMKWAAATGGSGAGDSDQIILGVQIFS